MRGLLRKGQLLRAFLLRQLAHDARAGASNEWVGLRLWQGSYTVYPNTWRYTSCEPTLKLTTSS